MPALRRFGMDISRTPCRFGRHDMTLRDSLQNLNIVPPTESKLKLYLYAGTLMSVGGRRAM